MADITSAQNQRVKLVRALQTQAKVRRQEGKFVAEGARLVGDALDCGLVPEYVLYTRQDETMPHPLADLFRRLLNQGVKILSVSQEVMDTISDLKTPPGLLAVFPQPRLSPPESPRLVLALDEIRNPGNLGSVLRTAVASGVDLVLLSPNTVEPYNPKVLRGGMGAHFRLPLLQLDWAEIAARYGHLAIYLADASGSLSYDAVDWRQPSMIILGSEARGPGQEARRLAQATISIPMAAETESLNAAVAAGVILYEAQRQRAAAREGPEI